MEIRGSLDLTTSAPATGRHRVDPGSTLLATVRAQVLDPAAEARLVLALPTGWTVVDDAGGIVDPMGLTLSWTIRDLAAGERVTRGPAASSPGDLARG